jgi:hypothetical protein
MEPYRMRVVDLHRAKEAVNSAPGLGALRPPKTNETAMFDPAHLRAQAQLCFAIADLMSEPSDAERVRSAAERYVSRAEKAERNLGEGGSAVRAAHKASR